MTSMALMIQQYTADAMQAQIHQAMDAQLREINAEGLGLARELPPLTLRNDRTIENGAILNLDRFEWGLVDEDGNSVIQVPTRHGIRRWIVNDNGVVDAILKTQARTPSEMGNVIHTLARFVGLFSRMMTQYSLKFSGQNFLSDGATAMNTGSHAGTIHSLSFLYNAERLATAFGLLGEKISEARGQEVSEAYRDFRLFGQMGSPYTTRSDASIDELRQSLYSKGDTLGERSAALVAHWKEIGTVKALAEAMANSVGLPVKALFHGVGAISEFGEEVTRYHEYKGAAKARAGKNKTAQEAYSDKIAAGKAARESTTDFSKHGNSELVQFYGALVPFARAQMEGVYKGIRLFSEENKGKRLAIGGTIIVNTMISKIVLSTLRDLMWNDEEKEAYEEMSAYERTKYEHIKLPGLGIVRLKRAQDPNVQFASALGEFLADSTTGFEGSDVANLVAMAREIAMGMVPSNDTIFDPWFDTLNNRTWYGGQIESARMQKLAKADRYKEDTPGLFRALGKLGGLSPLQWEQAFLSYTGSMGTIGVNTLKKGMDGFSLSDVLEAAGDELLGKNAWDPVYSSRATSVLYDHSTVLQGIISTAGMGRKSSGYLREMSPTEFDKAVGEAKKLTHKGGAIYEAQKRIDDLWNRHDKVMKLPGLDPEEREDMLRNIRRQINREALLGSEAAAQYHDRFGKKSVMEKIVERIDGK